MEPIISEEDFDEVQRILKQRGKARTQKKGLVREKQSRKYAFSSKLECAFCGSNLSRRNWNSNTSHKKTIWQCVVSTKKGRRFCEHAKGIPESVIQGAFMESYAMLCKNKSEVLDNFLATVEQSLNDSELPTQIKKLEGKISGLKSKLSKLADLLLDETIDREDFQQKYESTKREMQALQHQYEELKGQAVDEAKTQQRIEQLRKLIENEELTEFDEQVFDSVIEKVIVGEITEDGEYNPYKLTFIYRTGIKNEITPPYIGRLKKDEDLSSYSTHDTVKECSYSEADTR